MKGVTKYVFFNESDFIGSAQKSPERILKDLLPGSGLSLEELERLKNDAFPSAPLQLRMELITMG